MDSCHQIYPDDAVPLLLSDLPTQTWHDDARIRAHQLDRSHLEGDVCELLGKLHVSDVARKRSDCDAMLFETFRSDRERIDVEVGQQNIRTGGGRGRCDGQSDAAGTARYRDHPAWLHPHVPMITSWANEATRVPSGARTDPWASPLPFAM